MDEALKFFEDQKIIAVIRASEHSDADAIAKALMDGGIKILEITPNVPQYTKLIESISKQDQVLIGFGSAIDGEQAHRAINAGARYESSHYTDKNVFTVCKNNNVIVIQGASTVNEAIEAYNLGVDLVKIYPANFLGEVPYVSRLRRSFPFLKLVPSGGVNLDNFLDYLKAGATACVVGRSLCDKALIRAHQWTEITERAKQFVQKLESLKVTR
ncbi:MAG: bifunctional 4-hydroxy-2-oxoglutarate aldolase/2-dehydro-3-deoxy-phosphogluconate aldolase [Candidatus Omnitrophica bacterium]|nr:bifunctional 4-hydroxy-2-oxoglutarate aldolase/2-dehydro-3-deoxy-phosphogluconate aldolase [Candidatus Omnitrophota bacterium]